MSARADVYPNETEMRMRADFVRFLRYRMIDAPGAIGDISRTLETITWSWNLFTRYPPSDWAGKIAEYSWSIDAATLIEAWRDFEEART